jgi:hypothetical protein
MTLREWLLMQEHDVTVTELCKSCQDKSSNVLGGARGGEEAVLEHDDTSV